MRIGLFHLGAATVAATLLCPVARAAEHVTLRNGFSIECSRHETVDGQVRLYTSPEAYMDVAPSNIAKIEPVADQPAIAPKEIPNVFTQDAIKVISTTWAKDTIKEVSGARSKDKALSSEELHPFLLHAGAEHRIDEDLLASVVKAESAGHSAAVSRTGARGLMQLMPQTAAELGVADSFQPKDNIDGGAAYLDQLLTRYHDDVKLALAAYNAGPQAVDRYHGVPPYAETQAYVRRVILEFNRRKRLAATQVQNASTEVASR